MRIRESTLHPSSAIQSSPALKRKRIVIGLIVLGLVMFFSMWLSVATQSLFNRWDEPVNELFLGVRQRAPEWLTGAGNITTRLGSQGLTVVTIVLLLIWAFRRQFYRFWLMLAAVGGSELLWLLLIFLIDRGRPREIRAISGLVLPGFPSGHVMVFIAFFGVLLYIFLRQIKKQSLRLIVVGVVAALFILNGINRLYFNAHYLTDIIAGYGIGLAWTAFAITAVDWLSLKRQARKKQTL